MEQSNMPVEPVAQEDNVSSGADEFDFSYLDSNDAESDNDTSEFDDLDDDINDNDESVDDHQTTKKEKGKGVQLRMNELTAKRKQAEAERDALKAEIEEIKRMLKGDTNGNQESSKPKNEPRKKPTLEDYGYDSEAHSEALVDWKLEQRELAAKEAQVREAQEAEVRKSQSEVAKTIKAHTDKIASSKYKDFPVVMENLKGLNPIHDDAAQYVMESEVGEHIHYYLAKHPEKWTAISKLPRMKQIAEMNRIESAYKSKQNNFKKELSDPITPVKGNSDKVRKTRNLENVEIKSLKDYQRVYRRD